MTRRIQMSRKKGARLRDQSDDYVVVSRPTKWGNPFHDRIQAIEFLDRAMPMLGLGPLEAGCTDIQLYGFSFGLFLELRENGPVQPIILQYPTIETIKAELSGRDLACWCPCNEPYCHAELLLRIAAGHWP